MADTVWFC